MDLTLDACKPFFDAGMNFVLHDADTIRMMRRVGEDFRELRARYGDEYARHAEEPEPGRPPNGPIII